MWYGYDVIWVWCLIAKVLYSNTVGVYNDCLISFMKSVYTLLLLLTWWCIRFLFWNGGLYFSYYNNTSIIPVNGHSKLFIIIYYSHDFSHVTFSYWYHSVITNRICCLLQPWESRHDSSSLNTPLIDFAPPLCTCVNVLGSMNRVVMNILKIEYATEQF